MIKADWDCVLHHRSNASDKSKFLFGNQGTAAQEIKVEFGWQRWDWTQTIGLRNRCSLNSTGHGANEGNYRENNTAMELLMRTERKSAKYHWFAFINSRSSLTESYKPVMSGRDLSLGSKNLFEFVYTLLWLFIVCLSWESPLQTWWALVHIIPVFKYELDSQVRRYCFWHLTNLRTSFLYGFISHQEN